MALELGAEPVRLPLEARDCLALSITATNTGSEVVDPELHRAQLLVNGEPSSAWSLAIGNGPREPRWFALSPGESVTMSWSSLGSAVLPEPGEYRLELRLDDVRSRPVRVVVEPGS